MSGHLQVARVGRISGYVQSALSGSQVKAPGFAGGLEFGHFAYVRTDR